MSDRLNDFYERMHRIFDLSQAQQLLEWDQEVMMPAWGLTQRSHQLGSLAAIIHRLITDPVLMEHIQALTEQRGLDATAQADVREARRVCERAGRIPERLVTARTEACSLAQAAWSAARTQSDFAIFQPHLEHVVALTREMAEALDMPNRYDALLDEYEPGMTEAKLRILFSELREKLLPLLDAVRGSAHPPSADILHRRVPAASQERFCRQLLGDMGFEFRGGRFDVSTHPFTNGTFGDVRLTTRYLEDYLPAALFGAIHEAGHGLYEQGLHPERYRDPAGQSCSMGIHESQSRLWENLVGRSRGFWRRYYPDLQRAFAPVFDDVSEEGFYGAINTISPSLIRVEADETTYNLHIMLRFDIESDLIAGRVEVKDLPALWNDKMASYLGLVPPSDREGVLQDIHWSVGLFGYFPTYALGNMYAAQFMESMRAELPGLDERLAQGDLKAVKEWLNQRIHRHGRQWNAQELCLQVTGRPLSVDPLLRHLEAKAADCYGV